MRQDLNQARFTARWHQLAAGGHCDTWGGAESRRVYAEWVESGSPDTITEFIMARANIGPSDAMEDQKYQDERLKGRKVDGE